MNEVSTSEESHKENIEKLEEKYSALSESEMITEFYRIMAIPDARTNVIALSQMTALMNVFDKKGITLPVTEELPPNEKTTNSNTIKIFIVLLIIVILYYIFK